MMYVIKRHPLFYRALVLPDVHRGFRRWRHRVRWIDGYLIPLDAKGAPPTLARLVGGWNGRRK